MDFAVLISPLGGELSKRSGDSRGYLRARKNALIPSTTSRNCGPFRLLMALWSRRGRLKVGGEVEEDDEGKKDDSKGDKESSVDNKLLSCN